MNSEPTPDTPAQRDLKATNLQQIADDKAEKIARELRQFRWEVRTYYGVILLLVVGRTFNYF